MKKAITVAIVIVAVILFLLSIFNQNKVFILPEQRIYTLPLAEVTGTFKVFDGKVYAFGQRFTLERYTQEKWSKLYKDEWGIGIEDVLLEPRTGQKLSFDMKPYKEQLREGKYRIVIDAKEDKTKEEKKIYCYFSIR